MGILMKVLSFIPNGLSGLLGIVQAFVKFGKEVCTLAIDILSPVIPSEKFKAIIEKVRGFFNAIDSWIEKFKQILLRVNG
jgi:hypothetical protein